MTTDRNGKPLAIGDIVQCRSGQHSGKRHMTIIAFDKRQNETYLIGTCHETDKQTKWLSKGVIYHDQQN